MSHRPNKNDISIGKDLWIPFGDLNDGQGRAIQLDQMLGFVMPLLDRLETECVAACCGINAFRLWRDNVSAAMAGLSSPERDRMTSNLARIQAEVECLPTDIVVSARLNQYFRKEVFIEVLRHLRSVAEESNT